MCGLFGYSGELVNPLAIKLGLLENESRGRHSTGVYGNTMFKFAGSAGEAVQMPDLSLAIEGAKAVVGHTRFATMGAHTVENAHPFLREHEGSQIVGTHNGWIIDASLERAYKEFPFLDKVEVDSMLIFDLLLQSGYDYDTLSRLDGSMALGIIDNEGLLNIYKRQSKPLFLGYHDNGIYYSSLEEALTLIDCEDVEEVPNDTLLKFDEGKLVDAFKVDNPSITSIPLDCSAHSWRSHASDEEKAIYPIQSRRWDIKQRKWVNDTRNGGSDGEGCQSTFPRHGANNRNFGHNGRNGNQYSMVPSTVGDKLLDDVDLLLDKVSNIQSPDYSLNNVVRTVLEKRIKSNIDEYGEADVLDAEQDINNGFNNVFMLVLALQDQHGNSHPNLFVCFEDDPSIAGFTDQDGEVVLVVNRKTSKFNNGQKAVIQVQDPMDVALVERIEISVDYRKTRDAWFTMDASAIAAQTADNISSGAIKDATDHLNANNDEEENDITQASNGTDQSLLDQFYAEFPHLSKQLELAYWKQLGFDVAFKYEVAFWQWLRSDGLIAFGTYKGVVENDNMRTQEWLTRVDYGKWNLAWNVMTSYERDKRIEFHKYQAVKLIDNAYENFEDEVTSTLELINGASVEEIAKLEEKGNKLLDYCENFADEYNALAGSLNISFIQELLNNLKNYKYEPQV